MLYAVSHAYAIFTCVYAYYSKILLIYILLHDFDDFDFDTLQNSIGISHADWYRRDGGVPATLGQPHRKHRYHAIADAFDRFDRLHAASFSPLEFRSTTLYRLSAHTARLDITSVNSVSIRF